MKLRSLLIMLVVSSMFISGTVLLLADSQSHYGFTNTQNLTTFDSLGDVSDLVGSTEASLNTDTSKTSLDLITSGLFGTVMYFGNSISIFSNIFTDLSKILGLPSYVVVGLITILMIFIIYEIVQIFTRSST